MSDDSTRPVADRLTRRSLLAVGGLATAAPTLGALAARPVRGQTDAGTAGQDETPAEGDGQTPRLPGWIGIEQFRSSAIFRVESPPIEETPILEGAAGPGLENPHARVIQYFNTGEESLLYLPGDADVEQGLFYQFDDEFRLTEDEETPQQLVRTTFHRYSNQDLAFDLGETDIDVVGGSGGEGAVRPRDFSAGGLFRVTSGPLGWVPTDVAQSGHFTEYDTWHAQYVGTNEDFLFFPQEGAQVQTDVLYVLQDEFELFTPEGNLVACEFRRVESGSLPAGDYIP